MGDSATRRSPRNLIVMTDLVASGTHIDEWAVGTHRLSAQCGDAIDVNDDELLV
jgi:hypothetical protein